MEKNTDAVREFVKNPPHDAQFHDLYEAEDAAASEEDHGKAI